MLRYWLKQPQAKAFREMLPVMGVNGSLANNCKSCPAKGKVFAKTGTVSLPDYVNVGLLDNQSLGGYMEAKPGHFHVFYLVVNGAQAENIEDAIKIFDDVNNIGAILQQDASNQGGTSQGDQ
jgi:D-alanyl-D-alanine carboxypeptidase/D-alanyl-D-alanine-endopeptidase (penicillin-binding protein 4)